jgi:hypothetical protein
MYSTQLSDFKTYDVDNLILQPTERKTDVRRIRLLTHNLDGTKGDLIFSTPRLLSFGLQQIHDGETLVGYQIPLVMWGKNGPTPEEKAFVETLENITNVSKHYILKYREELEKPNLEENDLIRLNPLYYKADNTDGKSAPLLYVRLNTFRSDDNLHIRTLFIDDNTKQSIDPMTLLNKRCLIYAAIRFESIVLGSKVRFQLKLFEARVRFLDRGFKSLLEPGKVFSTYREKEKKSAV